MSEPRPLPELGRELWELVVTYLKQETIDPIKSLGRWVGFGAIGSLMMGTGLGMLALAGLRALQTETGTTFAGTSFASAAPYAIVAGGALVLAGLAVAAAARGGED